MSDEITKRWIEAGKIIADNAEKKVICPVCQDNFLKVWDVQNDDDDSLLERHMLCERCNAYNVLRLHRK